MQFLSCDCLFIEFLLIVCIQGMNKNKAPTENPKSSFYKTQGRGVYQGSLSSN